MKVVGITYHKTTATVKLDTYIDPVELGCRLDKNGSLILDLETVLKARLSQDCDIDLATLQSIIARSNQNRAYQAALRLLSRQDYSEAGLKRKLRQKYSADAAEYATKRVKSQGFLDDTAYAARLAEHYLLYKSQSKRLAIYNLMQKGVDRETAEQAVESLEIDAVAQIKSLIESKYKHKLQTPNDINKTKAALIRKGFDYSDIRRAIDEYIENEE